MVNRSCSILVIATLALAPLGTAHAQSDTHAAVSRARTTLVHLDVESPGTFEAISSLTRALGSARGADAREATFLRAVSASDVAFIARRRGDDAMLARVAEAYGCGADDLHARVTADLRTLRGGPFDAVARDVLAALEVSDESPMPTTQPGHSRSQTAFYAHTATRLLVTPDVVGVLAGLGEDPCGGSMSSCPEPYRNFGTQGRRAIAAMTRLFELPGAIRAAAEQGDAFAAIMVREGLLDTATLQSVRVAPRDWAFALGSIGTTDGGAPIEADAVMVVAQNEVRVGWVPEVAWDDEGHPHIAGQGSPLFGGESSALALPSSFPQQVRPIEELTAPLHDALHGAGRVAIAAEPGVEAHVLSRVLRTASEASVSVTSIIGVGEDGTPRGVAFQTVDEDASTPQNVGIFVRAGGFSVRGQGPYVSIPRVRASDTWTFDYASLHRVTEQRPDRPVVLRYMASAPAATVLRAALAVASPNRPIAVQVP